jgi:UPF0755 protein
MIKKILAILTIFVLILCGIFLYFLNDYKSSLSAIDNSNNVEVIFTIDEGQRAKQIASNLEKEKLIKDDLYFLATLYLEGKENKIQSGDYILKQSMSMKEIMDTITNGRATAKKVTIIEGWTLKDLSENLEKLNVSKIGDFYDVAGMPATDYRERIDKPENFSSEFSFLKDKPSWISLEGYLYPDTYYLPISAKPETVIKKALSNFDRKLTPEMRNEIEKQGKTVFEVVTMASILEKEVKSLEDKKIVAGILYKRMELDMPLQVDATTLYAQIKDDDSKIDTKYQSPYNTYAVKGLPLGPICNPSIESIEAAIHPEKSDYLFYLSKKSDGKTIFSKTFEEHKKAIRDHL